MGSALAKRAIPAVIKVATVGAIDANVEVERIAADMAGAISGDAVEHYLKSKEFLREFHEQINRSLDSANTFGKTPPFVILVDELDRCRPPYAISLLERIKHLFNVENVVFVLALDKEQLGVSLGAVYGQNLNVQEYLRRFFDAEFRLTQINSEIFCESLIERMRLDQILRHKTRSPTHR